MLGRPETFPKLTRLAGEEFDAAMALAREHLERLKPVIEQTERPGLWPLEKRRNNWWMMDRSIRGLEEKAFAPVILAGAFIHDFAATVKTGKAARYVRVHAVSISVLPDWRRGSGRECWIFADEILVNGAR